MFDSDFCPAIVSKSKLRYTCSHRVYDHHDREANETMFEGCMIETTF